MSLWLPEDPVLFGDQNVLKEVLDRYRRVLSGSGYAFWEWSLTENTYYCGGSFWENLGYETLDGVITTIDNVQEYVHPDDYDMVNKVILDHLRSDIPINMIYRIRAHDGEYWWTQACATSERDIDGRVTVLSGVNFDLSHLKDTEKALRLSEARHERILAASNDGIWEWTDDGSEDGSFHSSHSCWKHLGYSREEVDALPEKERLSVWRSHMHPHDLAAMQRELHRHFALKAPFDMEYRMFGQEGKMHWMRSRGQAVFNHEGRAISMSGINIDVTELKAAEERVHKAKNDAEKANQEKSSFLSSMSHELRTPLNAILGFSELAISDTGLSEEQRSHSQQIHNAGQHLLNLINDVLELSQIEAGKTSLSIEPVLVYRVVQECFDLVGSMAERKNIRLEFIPGDHTDSYVRADHIRLKQCLLNLLTNAVKYNLEGGEVKVVLYTQDSRMEISIEDTGEGISKDKQSEIFQPFNRLGAEYSSIEGSGIGLVITKQLVEKMRGDIRYCDLTARGACFKMTFPLDDSEVQQSAVDKDKPVTADDILVQFQETKSIHYIEDNISNIHLLQSMLNAYEKLDLECYMDPVVGLYNVRLHQPDLVFLDINLPYMSGLDVVKLLKLDPLTQHIPVIALSAHAMPHDVQQGKQAGFDEYLTKPISMTKLTNVLGAYLLD